MVDQFDSLFTENNSVESIEKIIKPEESSKCKCTRNTFVGNLSKRRPYVEFSDLGVFYHIAAMNNWKAVVLEQKEECDKLGLKPMCGLLGSDSDRLWAEELGLNILYHSTDIYEYESPTLKLLYDWSKNHPNGCVLYFHTKGVSAPQIINKQYWRWIMMEHIVANYKDNMQRLNIADIIGVSWSNGHFAHVSGNFWMARCDWINILMDPIDYQKINGPYIAGNPWKRMSAELWVGHQPFHMVDALCGTDLCMWCDNLFLYDKYKNKP